MLFKHICQIICQVSFRVQFCVYIIEEREKIAKLAKVTVY